MRFSTLTAVCVAVLTLTAAPAAPQDADLAAAAQNPVANLVSVPFQLNSFFGIGPEDEVVHVLNIQPVIPFSLSDRWNVITRTIAPLIYVPSSVEGLEVLPRGIGGDDTKFGLGDVNFTAFVSPARPGKLVWGVGPTLTAPTATDDLVGSEKWSAGPSVVLLAQPQPWTLGVLARQLWSFAGDDGRQDVEQLLVQPFVNYNLRKGWYLVSAPVVTANWNAGGDDRWIVPVGGGVGRLFRAGKLPLNVSGHAYYNLESPTLGPDWAFRFQVQLLFPK